jgi:hypothetical protein
MEISDEMFRTESNHIVFAAIDGFQFCELLALFHESSQNEFYIMILKNEFYIILYGFWILISLKYRPSNLHLDVKDEYYIIII